MDRNKMIFDSPARMFEEACLLGNGKIGAIVHGGVKEELVSFNIDSLWSCTERAGHNKKGAEHYDEIRNLVRSGNVSDLKKAHRIFKKYISGHDVGAYMPLADLKILSYGKTSGEKYLRVLDMSKGTVNVSTENDREYFVSKTDNVAVIRYSGNNLRLKIGLTSQLRFKSVLNGNGIELCGYAPYYTSNIELSVLKRGIYSKSKPVIKFSCGIKILTDGLIGRTAKEIKISGATFAEIYFTADTSYDHPENYRSNVKNTLENALKRGYSEIRNEHISDFGSLYDDCSVELCDCDFSGTCEKELEQFQKGDENLAPVVKLFNFGRYLMISGSRKGTHPLNLQGIWSDRTDPPWSSNYTTNINTEMNYWAVNQVGLSECEEPLLRHIGKMKEYGEKTARETYGSVGWVSGHNSDVFGKAAPVGRISFGIPCTYSQFLGCSGWLCFHLFEHYEYTLDKEWLRNYAYPIMKGAAEFYLDNLMESNTGLTLTPCASPENSYILEGETFSMCDGTTMDNSVVKQLFVHILKAADILGYDDDFVRNVRKVLPKIRPFIIGSKGQLLEWDKEYEEVDVHHRHISHLYANHPARLINDSTPDLQSAVKRSLELRGDDGTGWAIAWKVNQWARLKDGEHAYKLIKRHLRPCKSYGTKIYCNGGTYPNYLCAHPPFQIDGNFGVMSGIAEMLMQSDPDVIYILPALPERWKSGKVKNMMAKGGHKVSFEWKENAPLKVFIQSKNAETTVVYKDKKVTVRTNTEVEL